MPGQPPAKSCTKLPSRQVAQCPGGGQGQPGSESNGGHQASTGGENVTDAEFEEVK